MPTDTVSQFESSLDALDVGHTRTDSEEFADVLDAVLDLPAVGVPLNMDPISIDDSSVETPPTPRLLREANTGVTPAGKAIAEYGTLIIDADPVGGEPVSLYPPTHVAVVREGDVVSNIEDSTDHLGERFAGGGSSVFATGVSSTGDMGALVEGVHGPKHVYVIILEDEQ